MIKSGRYGTVKYDPAGVTPVALIALHGWKLSLKTDFDEVTCFGDANKVWVPGLPDISGTLAGFWDSTNVVIFAATRASTPGMLELAPNSTEPTFKFSGLAYLDADIDCTVKGAPKVTSSFKAAGSFTEAP
jgi:hypothetical protein